MQIIHAFIFIWSRKRQPTPVPLPGKSQGLRSLVGYAQGSQRSLHRAVVKNLPANSGDSGDTVLISVSGRSLHQEGPWRRKWRLTPVLLPGKFRGQRTWRAIVYGVAKSWTCTYIKKIYDFCEMFASMNITFSSIKCFQAEFNLI